MKKYFLITLAFVLGILIGASIPLKANDEIQNQAKIKFENVYPFTSVSGLLGFFDQKDGTVYVYDSNFTECVSVSKINKLGSALITTSKSTQSTY
ncbi:MAG: hypothetical protein AB1472_06880 [Candidatus Omnitrophota bacterium]